MRIRDYQLPLGINRALTLVTACSLLLPALAFAQSEECTAGQAISTQSIVEETSNLCCAQSGTSKQNKCINKAIKSFNKAKAFLAKAVREDVKAQLRTLRNSGCSSDTSNAIVCTDDSSVTIDEAVDEIRDNACDLRLQNSRRNSLKKAQRALNKIKKYVNEDYSSSLSSEITRLRSAKQCGGGGEKITTGCGRIVNPRDGATVGNVYKRSDHGGLPVFITHNGARSGSVITEKGAFITGLNYTGLGNRDPQGLRHHYRMSVSCGSLPSVFLLKIGGTCYRIDDRCGRID